MERGGVVGRSGGGGRDRGSGGEKRRGGRKSAGVVRVEGEAGSGCGGGKSRNLS